MSDEAKANLKEPRVEVEIGCCKPVIWFWDENGKCASIHADDLRAMWKSTHNQIVFDNWVLAMLRKQSPSLPSPSSGGGNG